MKGEKEVGVREGGAEVEGFKILDGVDGEVKDMAMKQKRTKVRTNRLQDF